MVLLLKRLRGSSIRTFSGADGWIVQLIGNRGGACCKCRRRAGSEGEGQQVESRDDPIADDDDSCLVGLVSSVDRVAYAYGTVICQIAAGASHR